MKINNELIKIVACPQCKSEVQLSEDENNVECNKCKLLYPVSESILIMHVEKATKSQ